MATPALKRFPSPRQSSAAWQSLWYAVWSPGGTTGRTAAKYNSRAVTGLRVGRFGSVFVVPVAPARALTLLGMGSLFALGVRLPFLGPGVFTASVSAASSTPLASGGTLGVRILVW